MALKLSWKYFTGAAIIVCGVLLPYAPLRSILLGLVIAVGMNWVLDTWTRSRSKR